jgi:hypothetical protein
MRQVARRTDCGLSAVADRAAAARASAGLVDRLRLGMARRAVDAVVTYKPQGEEGLMSQEYRELTREELDQIVGEDLPDRAAMSLINANVAVPVNAAVAANVLSNDSTATADAQQHAPITQVGL